MASRLVGAQEPSHQGFGGIPLPMASHEHGPRPQWLQTPGCNTAKSFGGCLEPSYASRRQRRMWSHPADTRRMANALRGSNLERKAHAACRQSTRRKPDGPHLELRPTTSGQIAVPGVQTPSLPELRFTTISGPAVQRTEALEATAKHKRRLGGQQFQQRQNGHGQLPRL